MMSHLLLDLLLDLHYLLLDLHCLLFSLLLLYDHQWQPDSMPFLMLRLIRKDRISLIIYLSSQQYSDKPSSTAFLEYLATLLARADLRSTDLGSLRQVEYDPSYYGQPGQEKIRFYILPIPSLKSRAGNGDDIPPEVCRAAPDRAVSEIAHVVFAHAAARSNFVQILKEGKLAASKLHFPDS